MHTHTVPHACAHTLVPTPHNRSRHRALCARAYSKLHTTRQTSAPIALRWLLRASPVRARAFYCGFIVRTCKNGEHSQSDGAYRIFIHPLSHTATHNFAPHSHCPSGSRATHTHAGPTLTDHKSFIVHDDDVAHE